MKVTGVGLAGSKSLYVETLNEHIQEKHPSLSNLVGFNFLYGGEFVEGMNFANEKARLYWAQFLSGVVVNLVEQAKLFEGAGGVETGARFSECRTWRYQLWRIWDRSLPMLVAICLNPSRADAFRSDNTVTKLCKYARQWGYGGVYVLNLHAFRSPYPAELMRASKAGIDTIGPENDYWIEQTVRTVAGGGGLVIAAWGNDGEFLGRGAQVLRMVPNPYRLGTLTKPGYPRHPLYLRGDLTPVPF